MAGSGKWGAPGGEPVAWSWSIAGIDPDTPVVGLGDHRRRERVSILMVDDEERAMLRQLVTDATVRKQNVRSFDSWGTRIIVIVTIVLGGGDLLARLADIAMRGH